MTITNPCGGKVIKQLWHCGWPSADGYPGAYPDRYLAYMRDLLSQIEGEDCWEPLLHLFSGSLDEGTTIDLNPDVNPTHVLDLTEDEIPYRDGHFRVVLADPPYSHKDYNASERHYGMKEVPRNSFVKEAVRVTQPGGYFAVLHVLPYRTPKECSRVAMIGVTVGSSQVIRAASIFRKERDQ